MADINVTETTIDINVTEQVIEILSPTGGYPLFSNVYSVFGRTGDVVAVNGDYTTSLVTEGTNLYYTQARFNTAFGLKSTTDLTEGANLYYTDVRARASNSFIAGSGAYNSTTGVITIPTNNNQITNGAAFITLTGLSVTTPLSYNNTTGAFTISQSNTTTNGYLGFSDWNTFNNKEGAVTAGTTLQYYRGDKTFQTLNTNVVVEGTNLYYTQARFDTAFGLKSTTDLTEGTNLYYTDTRARASITGTSPISVTSGVVAISQANTTTNGYLSFTDWNTFNAKQVALNGTGFVKITGTTISYDNSTYLTTIAGISAGGELSGTYASPSLVNSAVIGKVLTGVNITGGTVVDTDSILTAFGKVQNQINGLIGGSIYQGTWNASTNTPTLTSSVGTSGYYYIVSVPGTTNLNGITDWQLGDWAIYQGSEWEKVDNTDSVVSVNGFTGAVSLSTSNINEGSNLYFTNARTIASTLTSYTSGAGTVSATDTILTAIQKLNGNVSSIISGVSSVYGRTGAVVSNTGDYTTSQVTEGSNLYFTDARARAAISLTTTGTSGAATYTSGVLNIPQYQAVLTNPITGTGVNGRLTYFDGTTSVTSSANLTYSTDLTLLSGDIYATNPTASPSASFSAGKFLYSVGQIWNSAFGTRTMVGGFQVTSHQTNTNPTVSKLSFAVGTDNATATEKMYVTSTGLFNIAGGATFAGTTLNDTFNAVYIQNLSAATSSAAQPSNKLFLQGRSWNTSFGNVITNGYIQAVTATNNTSPTIEGLNFAPGSGLSTGTAATQLFVMTNQGRLGVNNLAPSHNLDVSGTARVTGVLTLSSTISNGTYTYTLPSATGTLALTSALSGYLPLTGGTLTGALSGTSATFSSTITANGGNILSSGSTYGIVQVKGSGASTWQMFANPSDEMRFGRSGVGDYLTIANTGAATFSSSVTATNGLFNGGGEVIRMYGSNPYIAWWDSANTTRYGYIQASSGLLNIVTNTGVDINFGAGGADRMRITSGGDVQFQKVGGSPSSGVGFTYYYGATAPFLSLVGDNTYVYFYNQTAGAYRFYVQGNGQINATSTSITAISDISLKENIRDLETGLSEILKLKPRRFDWKEETKIGEKNVAGFIAQELESILPELVYEYQYNDKETKKSIKMGDILPTLVKAIQEMNTKSEEQQATITSLNERLNKAGL